MARTDHDHRTPFDHEFEVGFDDADLTEEFWGTSRGWQPTRGHDEVAPSRRDDTTGAIQAIRDGMAAFRPQRVDLRDSTGQVRRTRTHGTVRRAPEAERQEPELSIAELAGGAPSDPVAHDPFLDDPVPADPFGDDPYASTPDRSDGFVDHDDDLVPLSPASPRRTRPSLGAVDPLLARFGAMALVGVLLVPVALALRPSDPDSVRIDTPTVMESGRSEAPAAGADPAAATGAVDQSDASSATAATSESDATADVAAAPPEQPVATDEPAASPEPAPADPPSVAGAAPAPEAVADTRSAPEAVADGGIGESATVDEPAERVVPECPQTYTAGAGDSWYRIADAAGVSPADVMAENRATGDTVILPGDEICLPAGATIPPPPPAPEPAVSATPTTTVAPATTTAPTTAPTTTAAPAPPASVEEVKAMIRATWPAEEHETAFRVAERESRFNPRADNNWCCYGVFQIYYTVHQSWLDDFGVYQASDLFDAEKNIAAAYHLYEQSGGWAPWGF